MMQTLSDSRGVTSELRINRVQFLYLIAVVAFAVVCVFVKPFTAGITDTLFVSKYIGLSAFLSAAFVPVLADLVIKILSGNAFKKFFKKVKNKVKSSIISEK